MRTELAAVLRCNVGFITQVLNGDSNFSLEHAIAVTDFLKLSGQEKDFFLLLVHREKAGTVKLRDYYQNQLEEILNQRAEIKSRIKSSSILDEKDYAIYYGQWSYTAIHMLLSITKYQSKSEVSKKLGLSLKEVTTVLEFLTKKNLVVEENGFYKTGPTRIHLNKSSPMILSHHANWRIEALKSLSNVQAEDLHYSSVLTMSKRDAKRIRDILLKAIEDVDIILGPSADEEIYAMNMDLFSFGPRD